MTKGPVIRRTDTSARMRKSKVLLTKFTEAMEGRMSNMISAGGLLDGFKWEDPYDAEGKLLSIRTMLAAEIKKGMLERKDQELEIAVMAMLVWFMRLEESRREAILSMWA